MSRPEAIPLVESDRWADRRDLSKASRLPIAALRARAAVGYPSILDSLVHMLEPQSYRRDAAQSRAVPPVSLSAADFPPLRAPRRRSDGEDRLLLEPVRNHSDGELSGSVQNGWPPARLRSLRLSHTQTRIVIRATQHRSELPLSTTAGDLFPGRLDSVR